MIEASFPHHDEQERSDLTRLIQTDSKGRTIPIGIVYFMNSKSSFALAKGSHRILSFASSARIFVKDSSKFLERLWTTANDHWLRNLFRFAASIMNCLISSLAVRLTGISASPTIFRTFFIIESKPLEKGLFHNERSENPDDFRTLYS